MWQANKNPAGAAATGAKRNLTSTKGGSNPYGDQVQGWFKQATAQGLDINTWIRQHPFTWTNPHMQRFAKSRGVLLQSPKPAITPVVGRTLPNPNNPGGAATPQTPAIEPPKPPKPPDVTVAPVNPLEVKHDSIYQRGEAEARQAMIGRTAADRSRLDAIDRVDPETGKTMYQMLLDQLKGDTLTSRYSSNAELASRGIYHSGGKRRRENLLAKAYNDKNLADRQAWGDIGRLEVSTRVGNEDAALVKVLEALGLEEADRRTAAGGTPDTSTAPLTQPPANTGGGSSAEKAPAPLSTPFTPFPGADPVQIPTLAGLMANPQVQSAGNPIGNPAAPGVKPKSIGAGVLNPNYKPEDPKNPGAASSPQYLPTPGATDPLQKPTSSTATAPGTLPKQLASALKGLTGPTKSVVETMVREYNLARGSNEYSRSGMTSWLRRKYPGKKAGQGTPAAELLISRLT